jgi:NAD(P)-dependent dehydrogenase (short-subunit alcohol dehydrogenase family)
MAAVDVFGSLDVVINNAGYGNLSSVEDTPLSEFRAQIETNLFGTIIVTKAAPKTESLSSISMRFFLP